MKELKQILTAAVAICVLSASALALEPQRRGEQKSPPPKEKSVIDKKDKDDSRRDEGRRENRENRDNKEEKGGKRGKP